MKLLTETERRREVSRIRAVHQWPNVVLPMKRYSDEMAGYECKLLSPFAYNDGRRLYDVNLITFSTRDDFRGKPLQECLDHYEYERFESFEALVDAGWVGD